MANKLRSLALAHAAMPRYVTKSLSFFLSASDETMLSTDLNGSIPTICFVDGAIWETREPPKKEQIDDCRSQIVFLWDQSACPQLPYQAQADGRACGPTSGVAIQFIRSAYQDGILTSGEMGIGYDKSNGLMREFVTAVWKSVKAMNIGTLRCVDRGTGQMIGTRIRDYVVGPGALATNRQGAILKHCAAEVYYRCEN